MSSQITTSDNTNWYLNEATPKPIVFEAEKWSVQDSTASGPYNNQPIVFKRNKTPALADYSRAFVAVPYVISCTQRATASIADVQSFSSPFICPQFKAGGSNNLVNRVQIQVGGGTQLGNSMDMNHIYSNLRYVFGTSESVHKTLGGRWLMGDRLPFDDVASYDNTLVGTASFTMTNCKANLTNTAGVFGSEGNPCPTFKKGPQSFSRGLYSRCVNIGTPAVMSTIAGNGYGVANPNAVKSRTTHVAWVVANTTNTAVVLGADGILVKGTAIIDLANIHDAFRALGIRSWLDLTITLSVSYCYDISIDANGLTTGGTCSNNFCPLIVPQSGFTALTTALSANECSFGGSISKVALVCGADVAQYVGGVFTPRGGQSCQLYIPEYELSDSMKRDFLNKNKKTIEFVDFTMNNSFINIPASGANVSHTLTGLVRPRKIYMLLYPAGASYANTGSVHTNATSFEPMYSSANLSVGRIQVRCNNNPLFNAPLDFQYVDFVANVQGALPNSGRILNGNTGLITKAFWDISKIYVFDVSRFSAEGLPSDVNIQFDNNCNIAMDVLYLVENLYTVDIDSTASDTLVSGAQRGI
jgi:hypothetical protein